MRIDRMLAITILLLNQDRVSAKKLADRFEVSIRTIYRDIEAINLAGIPVVSFSGNNGGFGIMDNYKIDRQLLTFQDMMSILSALKGVNTTLENKELDSAIEKISNLVPKDKEEELKLYFEQVVIDILPWGYRNRQREVLKQINSAVTQNRVINFDYRNAKGEFTNRELEPMTLIFKGYAWYLFGFCRLRQDFRLFRVSRIREIRVSDELFVRREGFYQDYMDSDENKKFKFVDLVLKFAPKVRVFIEDYFEYENIEYQDDGNLIVRVSFPEDDWVYSFILGYGDHVEVLEPAYIREMIQKKAENILKKYKPDIMLSQD